MARDDSSGTLDLVPPAEFSWGRYRSATLAGLTPVIPVPFLDDAVEWALARRVPAEVAASRSLELDRGAAGVLNASGRTWSQRAGGCLMAPVWFVIKLPLKLFRKVLIFLLVRAVANKLAEHWTRAYLIDVALRRGDLADAASAQRSAELIRHLVGEADEPLVQAGKEVFKQLKKLPLVGTLRRVRQHDERPDDEQRVQQAGDEVAGRWNRIAVQLEDVGRRYVELQAAADKPA